MCQRVKKNKKPLVTLLLMLLFLQPEPPLPDVVVPEGSCGSGMFTCENGECIQGSLYCNQEKHCSDETDEKDCPGILRLHVLLSTIF